MIFKITIDLDIMDPFESMVDIIEIDSREYEKIKDAETIETNWDFLRYNDYENTIQGSLVHYYLDWGKFKTYTPTADNLPMSDEYLEAYINKVKYHMLSKFIGNL